MKITPVILIALFIFVPTVSSAHLFHSEPKTTVSETATETELTVRSDVQERIAMLLRLIELLTLQLELLGGTVDTAERDITDTEADSSSVATAEIETTGDLTMATDANYRYFSSNGLPEYDISNNRYANTASEQDHDYRVPLNPEQNSRATYYELPYNFGIALNGVTFEPFAAEWYQNDRNSGWQEDPFVTLRDLDDYNAHVQPNGLYHYHGQPTSLFDDDDSEHSPVIGFAGDGFPIYGPFVYEDTDDPDSDIIEIDSNYELKSGTRPSGPGGTYDGTYNEDYEYSPGDTNDLDECNGRFGVTPEFEGSYYYVATESFPYIPRCLIGDQDPSFAGGPGGGGGPR